MDAKLLKEFEEMEGLSNETLVDPEWQTDKDQDDFDIKAVNASTMTSADVFYEMEKRGLSTTGFPDSDKEKLQKVFDDEAKAKQEEERAARQEKNRRRAQQEGLRRRRQQMEKSLQEEEDELAKNYQIGMMIDLIKDNDVDPSIRIDVNSITARSLAKALSVSSTITCLDLSSNGLNDHAGSYLVRALKRNKTLKKIELDNNYLGRKTIAALGESLKTNTALISLSLDSNPLFVGYEAEAEGIAPLKEALRVNKTLTSLNLWRTGIASLHGAMLANAIEVNDTILFCDVGHNQIDMSDIKRIVDKLDSNLAAFEAAERIRRDNAMTEEERQKKIRAIEEDEKKQEELTKWLDARRAERAESRRTKEEERVAEMQREAEIKRRQMEEDRERERKEKEEAAAKKAKKEKDKKNKKK